jgi:hypothetical protein
VGGIQADSFTQYSNFDLHFRTWVTSVPIPSAFFLFVSGILALEGFRKKFIR